MLIPPYELKCEYLVNPICIDVRKPRFSWILNHEERNQHQSAYQIIVSSNKNFSKNIIGDLWDTGKIISEKNNNIEYEGRTLESDSTYFWRVKWWDKNDVESDYSEINIFGTALFNKSDWRANWISRKELIDRKTRKQLQYISGNRKIAGKIRELRAIYLRKEFVIHNPVKYAKVYVCGVGFYELRLNGKKVGKRILDPAQTDYKKLALYSTYDITTDLKKNNAIGVILGNGRCIEIFGYDYPKLILQINIHYVDGKIDIIKTDESWRISDGPILENGIYYGETYDARLEMPGWDEPEFNDTVWKNASLVVGYNLSSQMMEPILISKRLKPQKLYSNKTGIYIYDFGQNFSGYVRLKVRGPRGCEIKLRFAEVVHEDGSINTATNGNAPSTDIYILKGDLEEIFEPHFTYHGFQYVELTGFPGIPTLENIDGVFFHSNVTKVGNFYCSNELINQIHSNVIWSQLSNLMSVPTDCPQREERQGWMGDAQLSAEEAIYNFDMARFYTKYIRDIKLCQRDDGAISEVAPPFWSIYPADPAWGTAYITITWYIYYYYNDIHILKENYDFLKRYVDFLSSISEENIISMGKYGDWCPPSCIISRKTPIKLISTWYYYHDTLLLSKIAKILKKNKDHNFYKNKAEDIKTAFNEEFFETYFYTAIKISQSDRTLSQTSNILPLYLDIVPKSYRKSILNTLIKAIKDDYDYHLDTGIVGTRYIFDTLTKNGFPDVVYKMINQKSFPGYGYMIHEGATTLWERWEKLEGGGMNSHNHIMLGSVDTWFYNTLVGIKSLEAGWELIKIKPYIPKNVSFARASILTIKGVIDCSWEKSTVDFKLTLSIPLGCDTEVWIPLLFENTMVKEGEKILLREGTPFDIENEIKCKRIDDEYVIFTIGSGYYNFSVKRIN